MKIRVLNSRKLPVFTLQALNGKGNVDILNEYYLSSLSSSSLLSSPTLFNIIIINCYYYTNYTIFRKVKIYNYSWNNSIQWTLRLFMSVLRKNSWKHSHAIRRPYFFKSPRIIIPTCGVAVITSLSTTNDV